ncbi:MAG: class I SAM-dependent methyltransferase [Gammaproteobacteria bacterium]|nr:class I SAM-dependent methyltransferase [Gammaproteobacteria bacterium]
MKSHNCPLCSSKKSQLYHTDNIREYHLCLACDFVFVPCIFHLSESDEKARYDQHRNDPNDLSYRKFLSQVSKPLLDRLSIKSKGLDFGCGPGPTLSIMLEEHGYTVDLFDKYYAQNSAVFNRKYDFITATEVLEHLSQPSFELNRLYNMLNPGGVLGIMTEMLSDNTSFVDWYYKNDPTHIGFFSRASLQRLASTWHAEIETLSSRVILITKTST